MKVIPLDHDHAHCIESALISAGRVCKQKGVRLTPLRKQVLALVWRSHKALGAYTIMDLMREQQAEKIAPPTVYRALEFLLAQGLVHRLNSVNAFIGCPLRESKRPHSPCFFICLSCLETREVDMPHLEKNIRVQAEEQGFSIERPSIEVTGLCRICQQKTPKSGDAK
ncbi:MAG: transcriptional repressor [Pseudomonadales bacterium]|nr:transcriptional repressor [Pseudomonadales bacterium]